MKTKILGILCLALSCTSITHAQPIMPATIPDVTAAVGNNVSNINCDALELQLSGNKYTLATIAWDNVVAGPIENVSLHVNFRGATVAGSVSRTVNISNAKRPDVMIGHTTNGYYIGLIYEMNQTIELRVYQVNLTLSPMNFTLSLLSTIKLENRLSEWPHIDGFTDANTTINGTPSIPEFAASWHYNSTSPGITMIAMGVTGNIEPPVTTTVIPWLVRSGEYNTDIAAYTDINTGDKCAAFVCVQNGLGSRTELIMTTAPVTNPLGAVTDWAPEYTSNPFVLGAPRIESQSQYDNASGNPAWVVVCPKQTSGGTYEINEYNSLSCMFCGAAQTVSTPFGTSNSYTQAAISAGTGMSSILGGTGKYNSFYQAIMHGVGTTIVNADNIVPTGGALALPYFDVNNTALPSPPLGFTTPVAASSTSNTGNYMMAAWWDNTNVKYKLVYDSIGVTPHYRSTGVNNIEASAEVALYPNPVTNTLSITGIDNAPYVMKDVVGHIIASGIANEKQPIDVSAFAPGNYFVEVNKGDKPYTLRFTKQ